MHGSVSESSGWNCEALMQQHRQVVAPAHQGQEKAVLNLAFTHHLHSEKIYSAKGPLITSIAVGVAIQQSLRP
jgi:hypothetical protein